MLIIFKEEITFRHVFFLNVRSIAFSSPALLLVPVSIFTGKALKGLRVVLLLCWYICFSWCIEQLNRSWPLVWTNYPLSRLPDAVSEQADGLGRCLLNISPALFLLEAPKVCTESLGWRWRPLPFSLSTFQCGQQVWRFVSCRPSVTSAMGHLGLLSLLFLLSLQWPQVLLCAGVDERKWSTLLSFAQLALYARTSDSTKTHTDLPGHPADVGVTTSTPTPEPPLGAACSLDFFGSSGVVQLNFTSQGLMAGPGVLGPDTRSRASCHTGNYPALATVSSQVSTGTHLLYCRCYWVFFPLFVVYLLIMGNETN